MKKWLATVLLLCMLPFAAMGEEVPGEVQIETPHLDVYFVPPESSILLTREDSASAFHRAGYWQPDMLAYMEEWDIYAFMEPDDGSRSWECSIMLWPDDEEDMMGVEQYRREVLCREYQVMYEQEGYAVDEVAYELSAGYEYVRVTCCYSEEGSPDFHHVIYITHQNGCGIWIDWIGMAPPTEAELQSLEWMADSLWCLRVRE